MKRSTELDLTYPRSVTAAAAIGYLRNVSFCDKVFRKGGAKPLSAAGLIGNQIKGLVSSAVACRVLRSSPVGFAKENNQ
jgi:hypothetical protein